MTSWGLAALAACATLSLACAKDTPAPQASPEDQATADHLADDMLTVARDADAKRTRALHAAVDSLVPRSDLGPCPIAVPIVGTEDRTKLGEGEPKSAPVDWRSIRGDQMMVVKKDALGTDKSVRLKHVEEMIAFEKGRVGLEGVAEVQKWIRYYGDLKNDSWEMVVVADRRVDPEVVADGKFREGIVAGRAYVYSYVDDAVVCAADVVARSSDVLTNHSVVTAEGKNYDLVFDLENEAFRAAARALVRAGPKPGATDAGSAPDASSDGGHAAKKR